MKKLPKFELSSEQSNINFKFYFFLKYIIKAKFSEHQALMILENSQLFSGWDKLNAFYTAICENIPNTTKSGLKQQDILSDIFIEINHEITLKVFLLSLKLYLIKDLLLEESKIKRTKNIEKLKQLHPLSLEYDKITVFNPYIVRVNGALLTLAFFDGLQNGFISQETDDFISILSDEVCYLQKHGLEPNQIFMLVFNESLNQSITSNSGSDYEHRIKSVLLNLGISEHNISKMHDKADKSTEFDLFFEIEGKTFGVSVKRTLRERYKQFIKTAQMSPIDVMIEITLGTDLTLEKAKAIVQHGVYLFIADEIYQTSAEFKNLDGVYSCQDLSLSLLKQLAQQESK